MNFIDRSINQITMYRLVLYGLCVLAVAAFILALVGKLPYQPISLAVSMVVVLASANFSNVLFAKLFKAPRNAESAWITGLILFFLASPPPLEIISTHGIKALLMLVALSATAMISKYVLVYKRRHIFNPVAIAAVIFGLVGSSLVVWWVATPVLSVITLFIGLLIARKLRRFAMLGAFAAASIGVALFTYVIPSGLSALQFIKEYFLVWQIVFFAVIMFTEPLTTPPTKWARITYGILVGGLLSSQINFGSVYTTPELALVIGNIFGFIVALASERGRTWGSIKLRLKSREKITVSVYDFKFVTDHPQSTLENSAVQNHNRFSFKPGQYMEWTLPHKSQDSRGNRRFFTVASSPTEADVCLGIRIDPKAASSFKRKLLTMEPGDSIWATHVDGEFTLPKNKQKLAFIAGGIGVTPFRSMIKYLQDKGEKLDITMIYQASSSADFAYGNLLEEASDKIGMKLIFSTDRLTSESIRSAIPDSAERIFYLSGPNAMVESYKDIIENLGAKEIKTDYFPGY